MRLVLLQPCIYNAVALLVVVVPLCMGNLSKKNHIAGSGDLKKTIKEVRNVLVTFSAILRLIND